MTMPKQRYTPSSIEARWRTQWEQEGIDEFRPDSDERKFYWLTMFPYPSGDLHIGHWYAMVPSDAGARFKRMNGYNVFFPVGFDAFGLPAENAAIKNNIHPREWTYRNIERMREQLKSMGAMFAWRNEVVTCEPDYYKWSQWQFLKFFERGLAYREFAPVDFCPSCNTTLAREQVVGEARECERCGTPVIKKELNQWKLRITQYAEELLNFDGIDWPEAVKVMQTNWIGRSEGVEFDMAIQGHPGQKLRVFTTRPDTLFGITFCVLSPEHPLVDRVTAPERRETVRAYRDAASRKTEIERLADSREQDGVFTGAFAINPMSGEAVPIWVADYVLMGYGTGAIMGVPAHDHRDLAFAHRYGLRVIPVIGPEGRTPPGFERGDGRPEQAYVEKAGSAMINSGPFSGLAWPESFHRTIEALEAEGIGQRTVNYRLRDWLISRQRMWGTPIPIIHCPDCGAVPVPYEDLPVLLPEDAVFKPTGESPLKYHEAFLHVACPRCGGAAERETDTMDTFICSSWYMYAYLSPYWKRGQPLTAQDRPWDERLARAWLPTDQYTGGIEHAILHLMYVRFWAMALADAGVLPVREPVLRLFNQGIILGEDNEKMSKSRGNVVNPDDLVRRYGADTVRAYLMFIGPWDQGGPWSPKGIEGLNRFLHDLWELGQPVPAADGSPQQAGPLLRALHLTLSKVGADFQAFKYNTLLAALMAFRNQLKGWQRELAGTAAWAEAIDTLILMMAPITPYLAEELWQRRHPGPSVHLQHWPQYRPELAAADTVTLVIQINGRIRDKMEIPADTTEEQTQLFALARPKVQEFLQGRTVRKVIPVGNKLVNIVA
jgi:leucyl-tRNA synthetase